MKKNILQLHDDLFGIFNSMVEDFFFSIGERNYFTADLDEGYGPGVLFYQDFKLDKHYDVYERKVYSFSGVLQDVGGIYNSLFFVGLFIYSRFQGSIYFSSLISKLYQVE
jgi:hypothetical protein